MTETNGTTTPPPAWARWLVPFLLLFVAGVQVGRVVALDQSTWIGGGFGMFATYDYDDTRVIAAWWETADGPVRADLSTVDATDRVRARVVPSVAHVDVILDQLLAGGVVAGASLLVVEVRGRTLVDDLLTFPTLVRGERVP